MRPVYVVFLLIGVTFAGGPPDPKLCPKRAASFIKQLNLIICTMKNAAKCFPVLLQCMDKSDNMYSLNRLLDECYKCSRKTIAFYWRLCSTCRKEDGALQETMCCMLDKLGEPPFGDREAFLSVLTKCANSSTLKACMSPTKPKPKPKPKPKVKVKVVTHTVKAKPGGLAGLINLSL